MAPEYQGKLCPGPKFDRCREHECQHWGFCKIADGDMMVELVAEVMGQLQLYLCKPEPQAEAVQPQPCADLEAMAERLVEDLLVIRGDSWKAHTTYKQMMAVALKALQEAHDGQFEAGRQDVLDNIGEVLENCTPRRANG